MFQSITDSVTSLSTSDFEKKVMKSNDDVKYEENEDATFRVSDRRSNDSVNSVAENVSSVISTCSTSDVTEGDLQGLSGEFINGTFVVLKKRHKRLLRCSA